MREIEFIDKEIKNIKEFLRLDDVLCLQTEEDYKFLYDRLKMFQQIKTKLEAWEVVKEHCDYQDGDRYNCIPEGFYLIEPIRGNDFLTIKKALEFKDE